MEELNAFQKEFMKTLSSIQERRVQIALCQNHANQSLEDMLYDITSQVIIDLMVVIDGYSDSDFGRLKVVSEKSGDSLKDKPYVELHDVVCEYLKGTT